MRRFARFCAGALAAVVLARGARAADANDGFSDGIDRNAPDFVQVSLLRTSPGEALFSCVGHVAIRLRCPTFRLDSCYSYESESTVSHLARFFAGKLKMGMFRIPTERFFADYARECRGIREYPLDLPPIAKQRLWRHMDELVEQGIHVPYDYVKRGCSKALLDCLNVAVAPATLKGPRAEKTIREVFQDELRENYPWNLFFILCLCGTETDIPITGGTPTTLVGFLSRATLEGRRVMTSAPIERSPWRKPPPPSPFTPTAVAVLVLALAAANALWLKSRTVTAVFLALQFLGGCFFAYLVTGSHLPTSAWNGMLVPLNPVMPVAWLVLRGREGCSRLRRMLFGGYAALLVVWIAAFLAVPHAAIEPASLILAAVYALHWVRFYFVENRIHRGRDCLNPVISG